MFEYYDPDATSVLKGTIWKDVCQKKQFRFYFKFFFSFDFLMGSFEDLPGKCSNRARPPTVPAARSAKEEMFYT